MNDISASIIVPIFNGEKFLKECIDSLVNQTLHDIEIILVDDGSVDSSMEICNEFAKTDDRIIILQQENSGSSNARNNGIEHSSGKYISFVDADDIICSNMIESLVNKAEETGAEIVICNYFRMYENESIAQNKHLTKDFILDTKDSINEFQRQLLIKGYKSDIPRLALLGVPWGRVYSRNMIERNNVRFQKELRIMQDEPFNLLAFQNSNRIAVMKEPLYNYRVLQSSMSNKPHETIIQYIENVFKVEESFCNKYKTDDKYFADILNVKKVVNTYKFFDKYYFTKSYLESHKFKEITRQIRDLLDREPYFSALKNINFKLLTKSELVFVLALKLRLYVLLCLMVKIRRRYVNGHLQ